MALNIKLVRGLEANLPTTIKDGVLLFTTDSGRIYFDIDGERIKLYDAAISDAKKAGTDAAAALTTYQTNVVGTPDTGKTIVDMIKALQTEIGGGGTTTPGEPGTGDGGGEDQNKSLAQRIADAEAAITTLNADSQTEGSVENTVSTAVAAIVANAPEDFDTLKEIADYIASDKTGAAQMTADISTLKGEDTVEGSVKKTVKDAIEALDVTDTAVDGEYVTSVSQVDGKIAVNRATLPSFDGLTWGTFDEISAEGNE